MNLTQKLRDVTNAILASEDPARAERDWELIARLLPRTPADQDQAQAALKSRDAAALDAIIRAIENPAPVEAGPDAASVAARFSAEERASALRAFRKRLKLVRLSDESKLGGRYTSGGCRSEIDAIEPPDGFPPEIWKSLAAAGQLKDTGQGFYALPD